MFRSSLFLLSRAFLALASSVLAQEPTQPWVWQSGLIPNPGFDLDQAQVLTVTSLDGDGSGSLREAVRVSGPRIIVFEVGGVIDLAQKSLNLREPDVYIAGQTAPPPGITLIQGGIRIETDRAVLQHLAVRPGDAGQPKGSGWEPDGISTSGGPRDVWVDQCSTTWSVDENLSATTYNSPHDGPAERIHFRNCLVAEALNDSSHTKGPHSKGTLVYGGTQHVAIVGCLYSSQVERNPLFQPGTSGVIVNNVIVNPGQRAMHGGVPKPENGKSTELARLSVVGNAVFFGQKSKRSARSIFEGQAQGFFKDNEGYDWFGKPLDVLRQPIPALDTPPVWPKGLEARSTTAALWHVTRFVGSRPAERDAIDQRIVSQAMSGSAHIIDSQNEVGGYPSYPATQRKLDVPQTNRQAWLEDLAAHVLFGAVDKKEGLQP
jgi:hypothetical protein